MYWEIFITQNFEPAEQSSDSDKKLYNFARCLHKIYI